jgi:hypothetical protein
MREVQKKMVPEMFDPGRLDRIEALRKVIGKILLTIRTTLIHGGLSGLAHHPLFSCLNSIIEFPPCERYNQDICR